MEQFQLLCGEMRLSLPISTSEEKLDPKPSECPNFLTYVCFPAFPSEIRATAGVKSSDREHFASEHFAFSLGIRFVMSLMVLMYSGAWFV